MVYVYISLIVRYVSGIFNKYRCLQISFYIDTINSQSLMPQNFYFLMLNFVWLCQKFDYQILLFDSPSSQVILSSSKINTNSRFSCNLVHFVRFSIHFIQNSYSYVCVFHNFCNLH